MAPPGRSAALAAVWALLALAVGLAGCGEEPLRHYRAPREAVSNTAMDALEWDLPVGWEQLPGSGGERLATLRIASTQPALEVAVTVLGGDQDPLANLNRWRRQLGLPEVDRAQAGDFMQPVQLAGGEQALFVDLTAAATPSSHSPATAPGMSAASPPVAAPGPTRLLVGMILGTSRSLFARLAGPAEALAPHAADFRAFVQSWRLARSRPADGAHGHQPASLTGWAAPADWVADATLAPPVLARWTLTRQGRNAEVSIQRHPRGMETLTAIYNQWRQRIGLGPLTGSAMDRFGMDRVGAAMAAASDLWAPETATQPAKADQRLLGVILILEDGYYSVDFSGPADLVTGEATAFRRFLDGMTFGAHGHE